MSSHDCTIRGTLKLKEGVTEPDISAALEPMLNWIDQSFEQVTGDDSVRYCPDDRTLEIMLDCHCSPGGGYRVEELEQTIEALGGLVSDPGYIELQDFDTGNTDEMITPHFIGATSAEQDRARVSYGIQAAQQWLEPVVGRESMVFARANHSCPSPRRAHGHAHCADGIMSYSCSDFADDIIETLVECGAIDADALPEDDPSRQADLAMAAVTRLAKKAKQLDDQRASPAAPA